MTTHTNCTHPATKAARAACRKGTAPAPAVDLAKAVAAANVNNSTDYSDFTYDFERVTCDRCLGSGTYPSAAWNGVCLKCNGKGQMLTRAGAAAKRAHDAWIDANLTVRLDSLKPGDKFRPSATEGWKTIVSIDTTPYYAGRMTIGSGDNAVTTEMWHIDVETKNMTFSMDKDRTVIRSATPAERNALILTLINRKGFQLIAK